MKNKKNSKKILSLVAILGVFLIVAVMVFGALKIISLNSTVIEILGVIAILCLGCIFAIPWVERLEEKKSKVVAIVFISVIIVCMALWIVCWILIMSAFRNSSELSVGLYNLIRISLVITIQFLVASTVSYFVLKYKKSMIVFQAITYLSYLYVDFYFTYLIICLKIVNGGFDFVGTDFIFSKIMIAILIIAFIYISISNAVVKSSNKRKLYRIASGETSSETESTSPDDRLKKLKNMLDNNLITPEEYEKKKDEILKDL